MHWNAMSVTVVPLLRLVECLRTESVGGIVGKRGVEAQHATVPSDRPLSILGIRILIQDTRAQVKGKAGWTIENRQWLAAKAHREMPPAVFSSLSTFIVRGCRPAGNWQLLNRCV